MNSDSRKCSLFIPVQKLITVTYFIFFLIGNPFVSKGQQNMPAVASQEIWPEVDAFYKINPGIRLMALASATKTNTYYEDGDFGINADFFILSHFRKEGPEIDLDSTRGYYQWFRGGLKFTRPDPSAKNTDGQFTIRTESNTRLYPGWKTMVTIRNRFDFVDKTEMVSVKYMPRVTWEKNFKTEYLNFDAFLYAEYYLYFKDETNNRFSVAAGFNVKVSRLILTQLYYLHQFEHQEKVGTLDAFGIKLIFYMPLKK